MLFVWNRSLSCKWAIGCLWDYMYEYSLRNVIFINKINTEFDLTLHKITAADVLQRAAFYFEDISEPVIFSLLFKQRSKTSTSVF